MSEKRQPGTRSAASTVEVDAGHDGQRLDNFLMARLRDVPRTRIYRMIRGGEVRVNRSRARPGQRLQDGDMVRIPPVQRVEREPAPKPGRDLAERLAEAVVYEDRGLLVINKPSGLAVHGGSGVSLGLVEALRSLRPELRFLELVHRLDRDTSGCVMLAKQRATLVELHAGLRDGRIRKRYRALVVGDWPEARQEVAIALQKNVLRSGERVVRAGGAGKAALTRYRVMARGRCGAMPLTLLEASPLTGRTHQIRVHCQVSGMPIAGDVKYGDDATNRALRSSGLRRLFLHAAGLEIPREGAGPRVVDAPLPDDLAGFLASCGVV